MVMTWALGNAVILFGILAIYDYRNHGPLRSLSGLAVAIYFIDLEAARFSTIEDARSSGYCLEGDVPLAANSLVDGSIDVRCPPIGFASGGGGWRRTIYADKIAIRAPIAKVWHELTEFENYHEWNIFTPRIDLVRSGASDEEEPISVGDEVVLLPKLPVLLGHSAVPEADEALL